ncbi:Rieske 2Fe-2S domain-containing protein [Skermanella sp. TT6]|uniref:Rieske 2Fe-2S domain-containing protein n=1 Tax=Skermanella cutis TaxID=2775420 RepID=A0ABX7B688_9PROT|nr:Rieske 2Fe-2S domain-containing protein [Skermanella sp. TT6]QQP89618.1 Rieske 2Fe-2S domain-containing protein [Skermanella sp. TT6]
MPEELCRLEDIPDGTGRGFTLRADGTAAGSAPLDILVVRQGDRVVGYVNSCPHARSPLDWTPDRFMSLDGRHIQCATHGALFEIGTGLCVGGPCIGSFLTPVAVTTRDGRVIVPDRTIGSAGASK